MVAPVLGATTIRKETKMQTLKEISIELLQAACFGDLSEVLPTGLSKRDYTDMRENMTKSIDLLLESTKAILLMFNTDLSNQASKCREVVKTLEAARDILDGWQALNAQREFAIFHILRGCMNMPNWNNIIFNDVDTLIKDMDIVDANYCITAYKLLSDQKNKSIVVSELY